MAVFQRGRIVRNIVLQTQFCTSFYSTHTDSNSFLFFSFVGQYTAISTKQHCAFFSQSLWHKLLNATGKYVVLSLTPFFWREQGVGRCAGWAEIRKTLPCGQELFPDALLLKWGGITRFTISFPFAPGFWFCFPCKDAKTLVPCNCEFKKFASFPNFVFFCPISWQISFKLSG